MNKNKHCGSNFQDFLKAEGIHEDVEMLALKRTLALKVEKLMEEKELTKTALAAQMKTSRAAIDRLLDASNTSVTLNTLEKAAIALGRKLKIDLVPA